MAGLPGTWLHSFIFLLQVDFHRQLVLDKKIQDRTGGGVEGSFEAAGILCGTLHF